MDRRWEVVCDLQGDDLIVRVEELALPRIIHHLPRLVTLLSVARCDGTGQTIDCQWTPESHFV